MHDLAVADPELLWAGFVGQHMRRHHHRRGGDDVDVVEVRRGGVRRGEEPQAPAQIVARRKAFGILECRRIDRIDGAKPIRQFAIEKGA